MTSTAGVDRCYHHQRYVDTCHDCRYTVEGVMATQTEDERNTLKKQNAKLRSALEQAIRRIEYLNVGGAEGADPTLVKARKALPPRRTGLLDPAR